MRDDLSLEETLEALLVVAIEPITAEELADIIEQDVEDVRNVLRALKEEYES